VNDKEVALSKTGVNNRLFYLATPPSVFLAAAASIRSAGLSTSGWTRVVVEKPFGRDSASSLELSRGLAEHLKEEQVCPVVVSVTVTCPCSLYVLVSNA
jgi:glucose-6-phosphate 1-dehydrogenase